MSDFFSGDKTTKGSTQAAGSATTTHQFTGSVYVKGLLSASLGISASTFVGDGSGLSNVGGGGISWDGSTANGIATFKDSDEATVESKFTYDGAAENLSLTGAFNHTGSHYLSGTLTITGVEATPMLVMDDQDASAQIGRTHLGYDGTNSDMAVFAHQDNANNTDFSLRQRSNGQTELNAKGSTGITFKIASATKMQVGAVGDVGIGNNYAPGYKLDVSGSTRLGTDPYGGSHKLFVTGGIIQTGSTALFHVADGQVSAFVISGSTGGQNPTQALMNVDTNSQWVRFGGGINIPQSWGVNFGVADGQGSGTGGKLSYNGNNLEISGAHNSTSIISGSVNIGYDTPTFTINAGAGVISATCDTGESSGFTIAGPTSLTGSEQYTVFKVEAADKTVDGGNPALVVDATGVGAGTASPKVALDISWNPTNLANNEGGGESVFFGSCSGPTVAGALYYLNSQGGWESASAHGTGSGNDTMLGIAKGTSPETNGMLIRGWFNVGTYYKEGFVTGSAVYIQSGTVGNTGYMSGAAPTVADSYVRIVGYASTQGEVIYFNPGTNWVELS
jgi:hypothetical protein